MEVSWGEENDTVDKILLLFNSAETVGLCTETMLYQESLKSVIEYS